MKFTLLTLTLFFLLPTMALAQDADLKLYWVQFKDKTDTPYSIQHPEEFLSPRALQRRQRQQIPITEEDLPVNPVYLNQLRQLGADIQYTTKWLNGTIITAGEQTFQALADLNFVKHTAYVGKYFPKSDLPKKSKKTKTSPEYEKISDHYGFVTPQIKMLRGDALHNLGYKGEGMLIAVLDGGFINADEMPFLSHLHDTKQFSNHKDFVDKDNQVFESSGHGSQVLSVMAANVPGVMVGTAPEASYVLIKTEDNRGEYRAEEYHWIAGIEYADSLGADVVNSSLGYSTFSDETMNYSYEQLNGKTSPASKVADIAFRKGMIVVTAMGNSGDSKWKYMAAPADAASVVAVGATTIEGEKANFSSYGPTADGRIKPDIAALGRRIGVASIYSPRVVVGNGTSFSSPLVAGLITALWQAYPEKSNKDIIKAIKKSASQATQPDHELGYGIPNFERAYWLLDGESN